MTQPTVSERAYEQCWLALAELEPDARNWGRVVGDFLPAYASLSVRQKEVLIADTKGAVRRRLARNYLAHVARQAAGKSNDEMQALARNAFSLTMLGLFAEDFRDGVMDLRAFVDEVSVAGQIDNVVFAWEQLTAERIPEPAAIIDHQLKNWLSE